MLQLSDQNGVAPDVLWKELDDILVEMGQTQTLPVVRWFGYVLSKIMRKIYKGVFVNEESIARVGGRKLAKFRYERDPSA
jgi:hypothetical protein